MIQLQKKKGVFQLTHNQKPFLILGGELGNSSASSLEYMENIWPRLVEMNLNTVLVPVYWELLEPEEGKFDFYLTDTILKDARHYNFNLIFLWFGSWKNSMSCYVPGWIKKNQEKYPRARRRDGSPMEILSAFSQTNRDTDARAFAAFLNHLHSVDHHDETVLMIQVENEVAMVEQPRDYSKAANKAYASPVPEQLLNFLSRNKNRLQPNLAELWAERGYRTSGSWEEVFGPGPMGEEILTAWSYACYVNHVTRAGKTEYPLPMFTNAALNRPGQIPGEYPSGGPLPHLLDIWQAGAPELDFFAPDIYFSDFGGWCEKYYMPDNPLFIPEAILNSTSAVNALFAIGQYNALGFSPFSIESATEENATSLGKCYKVLNQLTPLLLANQGKEQIAAVLIDTDNPTTGLKLDHFSLTCNHTYSFPWSPCKDDPLRPAAGAIIITMAPGEFIIAGSGVAITFESRDTGVQTGILYIEEGEFNEDHWIGGRRMNGDESHQGRHLRLEFGSWSIQRIKLYTYV